MVGTSLILKRGGGGWGGAEEQFCIFKTYWYFIDCPVGFLVTGKRGLFKRLLKVSLVKLGEFFCFVEEKLIG